MCRNLPLRPLVFAQQPAGTGADAVVLGYPGEAISATPARIREIIELNGRTSTAPPPSTARCTRSGYRAAGQSGGPMINRSGQVLGVVFGAAVDNNDTGFVLTAHEVSRQLAKANSTAKVPTGTCVNG